jgi:hypothetical protein
VNSARALLTSQRVELTIEDCAWLRLRDDSTLAALDIRLADLMRLHERGEGYLEQLKTTGDLGWQQAMKLLARGSRDVAFPATCLALVGWRREHPCP